MPGWSLYYLDYKGLKKIVSSLASGRTEPASSSTTLSLQPPVSAGTPSNIQRTSVKPDSSTIAGDAANLQDAQTMELLSFSGRDEDRGPVFQAHKTAFFFKLERELEKVRLIGILTHMRRFRSFIGLQINAFYLQKEAELKLRLETLLSKRRAAAGRFLPSDGDATPKDHVEWKAVEEGFRLLERDLAKLQVFITVYAHKRATLKSGAAIRGYQCNRISKDLEKMGQEIKIYYQGIVPFASSGGATCFQSTGTSIHFLGSFLC